MIHSPLERVSENLGKLEIVDPPALASRLFSFQLISRMLVISRKRLDIREKARRCVARGGRVLFGVSRGEGLLIIRQYGLSSFPSYQERGDIEIGNGEAVLPRFNR